MCKTNEYTLKIDIKMFDKEQKIKMYMVFFFIEFIKNTLTVLISSVASHLLDIDKMSPCIRNCVIYNPCDTKQTN